MLKIKDNVDLKELEKFGFTDKDEEFVEYTYEEKGSFTIGIRISKYNREINYTTRSWDGLWEEQADTLNVKLFDLIQAGLVEKVE